MQKIIGAILLTILTSFAFAGTITVLLQSASAVGVGSSVNFVKMSPDIPIANHAFQAILNGASADSATVTLEASNDNSHWLPLVTFNITSAVPTIGSQVVATYAYMRGNLTAISGAGASVSLIAAE